MILDTETPIPIDCPVERARGLGKVKGTRRNGSYKAAPLRPWGGYWARETRGPILARYTEERRRNGCASMRTTGMKRMWLLDMSAFALWGAFGFCVHSRQMKTSPH